jgi:hypothetical protein
LPETPGEPAAAKPDRVSPPHNADSGYSDVPPLTGRYRDQPLGARIAENHLLLTTVEQLKGCLSALPRRALVVLELRSGIGASHALSVAEVADYLNTSRQRIAKLERRGLRLLLRRSRVYACGESAGAASAAVYSSAAPRRAVPIAAMEAAGGGVQDFRATHAATGAPASGEDKLLAAAKPAADNPIVVALAVLGGMLILALVTTDALGIGPRHPQWRRRWLSRLLGR